LPLADGLPDTWQSFRAANHSSFATCVLRQTDTSNVPHSYEIVPKFSVNTQFTRFWWVLH